MMKYHFSLVLAVLWILGGAAPAEQPAAPTSVLRELNNSFVSVFEKVAPSVVVVESSRSASQPVPGLPQGLNFFLQPPHTRGQREQPDVGTGFVIRADGHILTNFHVVDGADEIFVRLHDGQRLPAEVVGFDPRTDLAVLKIEAVNLPVAELGDSDAVKVGQFALAIGTPMELPYTFTFGIVSAKGRNLALGPDTNEFIQTDASINPGNSGGPLCDIDGRVIGINTLISGSNRGLGFAIPINIAKNVAEQLVAKGGFARPWLGISIASVGEIEKPSFPEKGVFVCGIVRGAPAESSDLKPGDVILKVDDVPVHLVSDLQRQILGKKIGQKVQLDIWRGGRAMKLAVQTGEQPNPFLRASVRPRQNSKPSPATPPGTPPSSPLGMTVRDTSADALLAFGIIRQAAGGVLVTDVEPFSAAAVAGLEPGDIITEAGGRPLLKKQDWDEALANADPSLLLLLERDGKRTFAILKP